MNYEMVAYVTPTAPFGESSVLTLTRRYLSGGGICAAQNVRLTEQRCTIR